MLSLLITFFSCSTWFAVGLQSKRYTASLNADAARKRFEEKIVAATMKYRDGPLVEPLVATEKKYGDYEVMEKGIIYEMGGDRMSQSGDHEYAPIYSDFLSGVPTDEAHTVVETGVLGGTGLALWSDIFPKSEVYGFDVDTSRYTGNVENLKSKGMDDSRVHVHEMDQMQENKDKLKGILGEKRPDIIIDDGYHIAEAGYTTFGNLRPFLADKFTYFIEDIVKNQIDGDEWKEAKTKIMDDCPDCDMQFRCPHGQDKQECIAVITRNGGASQGGAP